MLLRCQELELHNKLQIQQRWMAGTLDDLHDTFNENAKTVDIASVREQHKRIVLNVGGNYNNIFIMKVKNQELYIRKIILTGVKHEVLWKMLLQLPHSRYL